MMKSFQKDALKVQIYPTRAEMGLHAAREIKVRILALLESQEAVNIIFAAAPSQNEVLQGLVSDPEIPWDRINAFHMDEYIGLPADAPQRFGNFLKERLFGLVAFKNVFYLDASAEDAWAECERYGSLLKEYPTDIVVMGIGENGHVAFNDPPVADFRDPQAVKPVALDEICRNQQVHDGCFASLEEVPETALTLTVPTLFSGKYLFCIVPAPTKAAAVRDTLQGSVGEVCPATVLRLHKNAVLYLDGESSSLLEETV